MKEKNISLKNALLLHVRAMRELHKVTPAYLPTATGAAFVEALVPYVTVYFSAKILEELALF